jgi:branched-chain amino acid transport system ATP-binding protein
MRFSQRIVVLDAGRKIAEGKPDDIVRDPAVERAYLGE